MSLKINFNLKTSFFIVWIIAFLLLIIYLMQPAPAVSTALTTHAECDIPAPAKVKPYLQERLKQLLAQQGSLSEKQAILNCISKATAKPGENTLAVDGVYYKLNEYVAAPNSKLINIDDIHFYLEKEGSSIKSVKIQGQAKTELLINDNATLASAGESVAPAVSELPKQWGGNIVPKGGQEEIVIENQTAVKNIIQFKFSVRFSDKSGKNLSGKLDTQTKTAELEKIGKGTYRQENGKWILSLNNNQIQITSK